MYQGYLKTAPEHAADGVLDLMKKPKIGVFEKFLDEFRAISKVCGKEQYTIPYIIIGHPGETLDDVYALRDFLRAKKLKNTSGTDIHAYSHELVHLHVLHRL